MPQGNHRWNPKLRRMFETTKGHAAWRLIVMRLAQVAHRESELEQFTGPVILELRFRLPRPKGHVKKDGTLRLGKPELPISSPDLSKLVRAVEDSLTGAGVWTDDSLVADLFARKRYASPGEEGVDVFVREVEL